MLIKRRARKVAAGFSRRAGESLRKPCDLSGPRNAAGSTDPGAKAAGAHAPLERRRWRLDHRALCRSTRGKRKSRGSHSGAFSSFPIIVNRFPRFKNGKCRQCSLLWLLVRRTGGVVYLLLAKTFTFRIFQILFKGTFTENDLCSSICIWGQFSQLILFYVANDYDGPNFEYIS